MVYGDVDFGPSTESVIRRISGESLSFLEMLRTLRVTIPQQGCLWRREVLDKVGGLDKRWQVVLDQEFFLRVASKCKIQYLKSTLGLFRDHTESKSFSQKAKWLTELPSMYEDFFKENERDCNIASHKRETMGVVFITCATIAWRINQRYTSIAYLKKALISDSIFLCRRYIWTKIYRFIYDRVARSVKVILWR
jgi:hypothetical protein